MFVHPYIAARIVARYHLELRQSASLRRARAGPAGQSWLHKAKPPRRVPRNWRWRYL